MLPPKRFFDLLCPFDRITSRSFQAAEAIAKSKTEAEAKAKASLEAARNKSNAAR
jgi:hypothetical protein